MKLEHLLSKLEGIHTINSIMTILEVNRQKAIYLIHRLRKNGYVKTRRLTGQQRVYEISFRNKLKGINYYEIINSVSPIKITEPEIYEIYGRVPSFEETLIFAIKTNSLRTIAASLALFRKIRDWDEIYKLAKINHIERQVGALYDLSRKLFRTTKMTKRFRNKTIPKGEYPFVFIVKDMRSDDFQDIEVRWRTYLPFNRQDLGEYT